MKRRLVVSLIFLLAVGLCGGLIWFNFFRDRMIADFFSKMQPPPQTVAAVEAKTQEWTPGIRAIGTASAQNGVQLAVEASGMVREIFIQPNKRFRKGEPLVHLDDSVEKADLADVEATLALTEANFERSSSLRSRGFDTQAAYDQTVQQLASARARKARLQAVIAQKTLRAPFDGVAGIARIDIGQFVQAGTVATTFQDLSNMKVDFTVPEQQVARVRIGQTVRAGVTETDLPWQGTVTGIDPRIDPQTRLASVQARLAENKDESILPGQFLHVRIELPKEPDVITVPQTAVVPSLYGDYVFVVETDDKATPPRKVVKQVFVKVGRREGPAVEILSGVKPGEVVVTSGQNKLQVGGAVTIDNSFRGAPGEARQAQR